MEEYITDSNSHNKFLPNGKSIECSDCEEESTKEIAEEPASLAQNVRLCLVGSLTTDEHVLQAAQSFNVPVVTSEDASDWEHSVVGCTVFVLEEFSGPVFDKLHGLGHRILGPVALRELADRGSPLPLNTRPLCTLAMLGLVICFTGFHKKDELARLIKLIHNMGGSIRKDMSSSVTHLVANKCSGEKYQYALTFRVPVMAASWVHNAWAMRPNIGFNGADLQNNAEHKLKPFHGARVCLYGFPEEEQKHMTDILVENGGTLTDKDDPQCTHVVIDESTISQIPAQVASSTTHIVKAEWFWASVQNEGCVDEKDYLFEDYLESLVSPSRRTPTSSSTTPLSVGRARKRKRLQEVVSRMVASSNTTPAVNKRRSSVSDAGLLSCTPSPTTQLTDETEAVNAIETPRKHMSPRHQVFLELVQTESNYVGILSTIMTLFKEPLEKMCETEDHLLNLTEIKIIFGHLPPIYQTHCQMLEQLKWTTSHWTEDVSIGNIFLKFAPDLVKAYPPFVNFFENTREMLVNCDQTKPRFHAFLKKCQTKPECGRQSLQELLIRPIQRLASVTLLLNDILKHTNKNNNDYCALEAALNVIKEVMTHINEDKRRTEGQLAMFDIFNDIDNCPPHLVSSHRSFIARCDLTELSDSLSGRGDPLAFFLFSDILEVCKKRSKAFANSLKSPNAPSGTTKLNNCKPFKHVRLMPLSTVKRVIDIKETDECHKVFALMCRSNQELKEKLYSFMITDEETNKMVFLKSLCRQMANTVCRADAENFLASLDPEQLDIDTSDVGLGTLGKAFKFASRTRMRVGRAFSFNKTPSKLKRAMSTMMSPFGSSSNLTPASQLAQMRLASCNNLNELTSGAGGTPPALPAPPQYAVPMSVQPQRRSKPLSVTSLRRL
ncbi:epithelial cell transforming 2 pebble [Lycorma delicatula]|uniref:epithelial cell transforming 2 pebble n=1 Tax=Lycorma delicatula TaxID=130591 RepID=UPI003F511201